MYCNLCLPVYIMPSTCQHWCTIFKLISLITISLIAIIVIFIAIVIFIDDIVVMTIIVIIVIMSWMLVATAP